MEFKKIALKKSWSEIAQAKLAMTASDTIPERVLALTEKYFDKNSNKKIKGFYTDELPKMLNQEPYPVAVLDSAQAKKELPTSSKGAHFKEKKYFVPSFEEIPASYFDEDPADEIKMPANMEVNGTNIK